jgi:electron transport complex protein RnfD
MKRPDLHVSVSPHVHSGNTIRKMTLENIAALIPTTFAGWFFFGWSALTTVLIAAVAALLAEFLWQKLFRPPVRVQDGSAVLTGLLLGLILSTMSPWWLPALGAFVAILLGKQLFGGLGNHPFSAVLVGWTFLQVSYKGLMEEMPLPEPQFLLHPGEYLAYSPLYTLRDSGVEAIGYVPWADFLWGNVPGTIGTVSVIAVLLGGLYLIYRRIISWHIPVSFIASAWLFALIFWLIDSEVYANPTFHIVSGWIMLGAFFLATEKGTAPVTVPGMIVYGAGCGILTMIIRTWGTYIEGVPFAILLMNALTPLLDRLRPRVAGRVKELA